MLLDVRQPPDPTSTRARYHEILHRVPQENVEKVRSLLEPFAGINIADVDWGAEAIRESVRAMRTQDVELRTLASGPGTGVGTHYRGIGRRGSVFAGVARAL
jgi:hypothetical protein